MTRRCKIKGVKSQNSQKITIIGCKTSKDRHNVTANKYTILKNRHKVTTKTQRETNGLFLTRQKMTTEEIKMSPNK